MTDDKIRVRFINIYGLGIEPKEVKQDNQPQPKMISNASEYKDILISPKALKETKTKPYNVFFWRGGSYIYSSELVRSFDSEGHPIAKFYIGNSNQIIEETPQEPLINGMKISAEVFDKTFRRGEMKAIIASSQKETGKFDWMTIIIGVVMGVGLGFPLGIVLHDYIFHVTTTSTTVVKGLIEAGVRAILHV